MKEASDVTVLSGHDAVLLDLDGTVYRGGELVPGADEAIARVRECGVAVRYVTNNASQSKRDFAERLGTLGLNAALDEINTSPEAAAAMLSAHVPRGTVVLVLGSAALEAEVETAGFSAVRGHTGKTAAVVQGLSMDITWADLAEAALALQDGAVWVATNADATLPTERGQLPGNGSLVAALVTTSGREPWVAGKPERPLLDNAVASVGARAPLFVGDRLDTDIAGATRAGMAGMLVLTGVGQPRHVVEAPVEQRPSYLGADLSALHEPLTRVRVGQHQPGWASCVRNGVLELASSEPDRLGDAVSALRCLCAVWWDNGGGPVNVRGADGPARAVLSELDLLQQGSC